MNRVAQTVNDLGPLLVTSVILGSWVTHSLGFGTTWSPADEDLMKNCLILVIGYWLGSSSGSARKTELMGPK